MAVPAVRNAVRTWSERFEAGDTVLVAVSGGADSLALAHALSVEAKLLAINVVGVTVDHQLQKKICHTSAKNCEPTFGNEFKVYCKKS